MKAYLAYFRYLIGSSFWFVPGLMALGGMLLSFLSLQLDATSAGQWVERWNWFAEIRPEAARQVLSTTAGSMMTVTSLVFTMTLATLTLASTQLGPRLLRTFMADRVNQIVLGTFTATFLFNLLILRSIDDGPAASVPTISVAMALLLVVISVWLLIFFIHHLASSIRSDNVIARVGKELDQSLKAIFPEEDAEFPSAPPVPPIRRSLTAKNAGYVQAIDHQALARLAARHQVFVKLDRRAGHFVVADGGLGWVWPPERVSERLLRGMHEAIVIGPTRTPAQDAEFSIRALVEIALRALSPALNDPDTASACVDRLGASLSLAMRRGRYQPLWMADDTVRVIGQPISVEDMLDAAFNEIRQNAVRNAAVTIRLLEMLGSLVQFARRPERIAAIRKHADSVARSWDAGAFPPQDRSDVRARVVELDQRLKEAEEAAGLRRKGPRHDQFAG